jgi:hypothetical protein
MSQEAASSAGGAGMMSLHRAVMTAAVAEYVEGSCCCALQFKSSMFKWGNCRFLKYFLWVSALIFLWWHLN